MDEKGLYFALALHNLVPYRWDESVNIPCGPMTKCVIASGRRMPVLYDCSPQSSLTMFHKIEHVIAEKKGDE